MKFVRERRRRFRLFEAQKGQAIDRYRIAGGDNNAEAKAAINALVVGEREQLAYMRCLGGKKG